MVPNGCLSCVLPRRRKVVLTPVSFHSLLLGYCVWYCSNLLWHISQWPQHPQVTMLSASDPYYVAKEEVAKAMDRLRGRF